MMYDIVVIGAGPAGCLAALELQRNNFSVALIDQPRALQRKVGESLPGSSRPLLQKLEILSLVENGGHLQSYGNQSVWGSAEVRAQDFIADPSGPGWHLNRVKFDQDLRELTWKKGVPFINSRVQNLQKQKVGWTLEINTGALEAGFLIDASGRSSLVARNQKIDRTIDDQLVASYFWLGSNANDHDSRTLIEATSRGWWYTSKLPGQARILAFHTDADLLEELSENERLTGELQATTQTRELTTGIALSKVYRQSAYGSNLSQYAGPGWLACGDAAMTFDPLSSQGIFNALYSGNLAGETIVRMAGGDKDAFFSYHQKLAKIRETYLLHHQIYYAFESRWPESEFWKRRSFQPTSVQRLLSVSQSETLTEFSSDLKSALSLQQSTDICRDLDFTDS